MSFKAAQAHAHTCLFILSFTHTTHMHTHTLSPYLSLSLSLSCCSQAIAVPSAISTALLHRDLQLAFMGTESTSFSLNRSSLTLTPRTHIREYAHTTTTTMSLLARHCEAASALVQLSVRACVCACVCVCVRVCVFVHIDVLVCV